MWSPAQEHVSDERIADSYTGVRESPSGHQTLISISRAKVGELRRRQYYCSRSASYLPFLSLVQNGLCTNAPKGSLKDLAGGQAVREVGHAGVRPVSITLSSNRRH